MTIKELLEMEIHEEYVFNHKIVIRVPGGWIYETEDSQGMERIQAG